MTYLGENIPKLGFGLMRLPRLEGGAPDVEQVKQMVDAFMDAGCTYFDTARAYGDSEEVIRQALVERYPRESFQLATKNAAWAGPKSYEDARNDFEISLENTGAGYFDFYLLHNTGASRTQVFDDLEMWDWVKQLKADGKVKHIGFSHHDSGEVLDEILTAHPEMEFVQLQVNWADWESASVQSRKVVEVARKHDKPVIVMEPIRGGGLADPPEAVAKILHDANPDASCAEWALRFAFGIDGLVTALSGMSTLEQMQENLEVYKNYKPLTDDEHQVLVNAREELDKLLDNVCTACRYCVKVCPIDMPINEIMDALNRASLFGQPVGQNWYSFQTGGPDGVKASECLHCHACEQACPQKIEIIDKLEHAVELFE